MIEVENLSIAYGHGTRAIATLEGIAFSVGKGELVSIVGPSGCGKSTLLFALDGLITPTEGHIHIDGDEVQGIRRDVALILQDAGLLPWKTVRQNAELALRIQGIADDAGATLESLGLAGFESRYPGELSEGMKRRVGIARALALHPRVLLMDEPMANLDSLTRERIQNLILDLWRRLRFTSVLVTHDIEEALFLGQRVLVMTPRPATLTEILPNPEAGSMDYRGSEEFHARVQYLRDTLESEAA
ncbi:MAG: ABC transporter ATP-binding protein [Candidatus Bipolaricaulota bacterium]